MVLIFRCIVVCCANVGIRGLRGVSALRRHSHSATEGDLQQRGRELGAGLLGGYIVNDLLTNVRLYVLLSTLPRIINA
eukprot:COSAG05_NODE_612_length_8357_cov_40.832647_1_plen_78_part_00